jgi:hypothetical protein
MSILRFFRTRAGTTGVTKRRPSIPKRGNCRFPRNRIRALCHVSWYHGQNGQIAFHCLMPGATYTLGGHSGMTGGKVWIHGNIRVEPGQTFHLGDVQVKVPKR